MSDKFRKERLPDLPNAGYATKRQKELTDAVMFFIRGAERERALLLMYVIEGPEVFVPRYMKAHAYLGIDRELAEAVYGYLKMLAGPDPQQQLAALIKVLPFKPTEVPS